MLNAADKTRKQRPVPPRTSVFVSESRLGLAKEQNKNQDNDNNEKQTAADIHPTGSFLSVVCVLSHLGATPLAVERHRSGCCRG